jgi:hypothetical protein
VLPLEKIKFNIRNWVPNKVKSQKLKLTSDNNNKENISTKSIASVPSLHDMEFNWVEDY